MSKPEWGEESLRFRRWKKGEEGKGGMLLTPYVEKKPILTFFGGEPKGNGTMCRREEEREP